MREERQEDQHIMKRVWNESERERDESDKWEGHWKKTKYQVLGSVFLHSSLPH